MTTVSAVPAAIDALVAKFTATMGSDAVFDGPVPSSTAVQSYVIVGSSTADGLDDAASSQQGPAGYANTGNRRETLIVHCVAVAWNGDTDVKAARNAAYATLKVATDAVAADTSLGTASNLFVDGFSVNTLSYQQDSMGVLVALQFDVSIHAYLS